MNPGCDASVSTSRSRRRERGDKKNQTDSRKDEQTPERANISEQQEIERWQGDEPLQRETRDEVRMVDEERRQEKETEETRQKMEREKKSWQAEVVERANDSLVNVDYSVCGVMCAIFVLD